MVWYYMRIVCQQTILMNIMPYLLFLRKKNSKIWNYRLLQIISGALRVKFEKCSYSLVPVISSRTPVPFHFWAAFISSSVTPTSWNRIYMGESSKYPKSWTIEIQFLKLAGCLQKWIISSLNDKLCLDHLKTNQRSIKICLIQYFEADFLWKTFTHEFIGQDLLIVEVIRCN